MDLIQMKIKKDPSMVQYIKRIRKFDPSLTIGAVKGAIETGGFVLEYDLDSYDVLEALEGIDRKRVFRAFLQDLLDLGAEVELFQNREPITLDFLDNWLDTCDEIARQVERDCDLEAGPD